MRPRLARLFGCTYPHGLYIAPNLRNQIVKAGVDLLRTQSLHKLQPNRCSIDLGAVVVQQVRFDARLRYITEVRVSSDADGRAEASLAGWQQRPPGIDAFGGYLLSWHEREVRRGKTDLTSTMVAVHDGPFD